MHSFFNKILNFTARSIKWLKPFTGVAFNLASVNCFSRPPFAGRAALAQTVPSRPRWFSCFFPLSRIKSYNSNWWQQLWAEIGRQNWLRRENQDKLNERIWTLSNVWTEPGWLNLILPRHDNRHKCQCQSSVSQPSSLQGPFFEDGLTSARDELGNWFQMTSNDKPQSARNRPRGARNLNPASTKEQRFSNTFRPLSVLCHWIGIEFLSNPALVLALGRWDILMK